MVKATSYAIHDMVKFQIRNTTSPMKKLFDKTRVQFCNFSTDNDAMDYDFIVEIGPFSRKRRSCIILDDTYHVSDNYFYFTDKRKKAEWEVEISDIEGLSKVRIRTNFVGNITAPLNIIEYLIQYFLLKKGIAIIHASGVGKDNKGLAFSARGGGGKTTVALSLVDRGYSYFGDNYVILDRGVMKSYISPLNIFSYNRLPIVEKALTRRQKYILALKQKLYDLTGGYYKIFEKINPKDCFAGAVQNQAEIKAIFFLEPCNLEVIAKPDIIKLEYSQAIKKLRYNMELDLMAFTKCVYSYGYIFPGSIFGRFWRIYEENLRKNLSDKCPVSIIRVPLRYNEQFIRGLLERINCFIREGF